MKKIWGFGNKVGRFFSRTKDGGDTDEKEVQKENEKRQGKGNHRAAIGKEDYGSRVQKEDELSRGLGFNSNTNSDEEGDEFEDAIGHFDTKDSDGDMAVAYAGKEKRNITVLEAKAANLIIGDHATNIHYHNYGSKCDKSNSGSNSEESDDDIDTGDSDEECRGTKSNNIGENISGESLKAPRKQVSIDMELHEHLQNVSLWTEDVDLRLNCLDYLQQLSEIVEKLAFEKGNYDFWTKILEKDKTLATYFSKIIELETSPDVDIETIKLFLIRLIRPVGERRILNGNRLKTWLKLTDTSQSRLSELTNREIDSLDNFFLILKNEFLPSVRNNEMVLNLEKESEKERFETYVTEQMALGAKSLLCKLKKQDRNEDFVFFHLLLHSLSYDRSSKVFKSLISISKLENFVVEAERRIAEFANYTRMQQHIFLIREAIKVCKGINGTKRRDETFLLLLDPIVNVLDKKIAEVFTTHVTQSPLELVKLSRNLECIHNNDSGLIKQIDLSKLSMSLKTSKHTSMADNRKGNTCQLPLTKENDNIIRSLGLEEYFPSKIHLKDVMKIQEDGTMTDLSKIFWLILKKIMMLDHRARDHVLFDIYRKNTPYATLQYSGDLSSFDDAKPVVLQYPNPLDAFLAVFCCCDELLKQAVVNKMFLCQLAVPLVFQPFLDGKLCFSLWPLRTLSVEGKVVPLIREPTKIVSFIRFNRPTYSKSKLMSGILSDYHHNVYYNKDSPLGDTNKILAEGLVECSWYIPSDSKNETIKEIVTCLNLRGNALEHKQQLAFLQEISNVIYVVLDIEDIVSTTCLTELLQLYRTSENIGLLLTNDNDMKSAWDILQKYKTKVGSNANRTKFFFLTVQGQARNIEELKTEIQMHLSIKCESGKTKQLINCSGTAKDLGMSIDEDESKCSLSKAYADEVISCIDPKSDIDSFIDQTFQLQGKLLRSWCEKNKEQSKTVDRNNPVYNEDLITDMKRLREEQVKVCQNLPPFIHRLIEALIKFQDSEEILLQFFIWISVSFDEIFSYTCFKKRQMEIENQTCSNLERKMRSRIGIEHVVREIGQIYEAVIETREGIANEVIEMIDTLPFVVAKLLLRGQSLEIMDGDNANIPMNWVKAVFRSLQSLTDNARILVIAAVGIQSSGKSTLVNAMFGTQFSVSAGRCSKGIFMQMIENSNFPGYEYVLILDSEGLRSEETSTSTHDADNKLATFVIEMSDVTIVNLKGENCAVFKEVLEIVVHAFLRLKVANGNIKLRQSCIFLHQNVDASNADEKTYPGRKQLLKNLNEMTKHAAEEEEILDVTEFNHVIEFDSATDCYFFKNFWNGNPPRAFVNHAYSEKVSEIRQVSCSRASAKSQLRISDISTHIEDLWNGIISDNFIFSFHNSREVKAYNILEKKYNSLRWKFESSVFKKGLRASTQRLRWHKTIEENERNLNLVHAELERHIRDLAHNIKTELEDFIENNEVRNLLLTWKQAKLQAINLLVDTLIEKSRNHLLETQDQLRLDATLSKRDKELKKQIKECAKEFYEIQSDEKPSEEQINDGFEVKWIGVLQNMASREHLGSTTTVEQAIQGKLNAIFSTNVQLLQKELSKTPLHKRITLGRLEGSIKIDDIEKDHLRIEKTFKGFKIKTVKSRDECYLETINLTDQVFRKVDKYLDDLSQTDTKFDDAYLNTLLMYVHDEIENFNKNLSPQRHFSLRKQYVIKMSVHLCQFALSRFEALNEKYENKHSTMSWTEAQKDKSKMLFKNTIYQKTEENYAASLLCTSIEDALLRVVKNQLPSLIQEHLLKQFSNRKSVLLRDIMLHLLEQNAEEFGEYIDDSYRYAEKWLTSFSQSYLTKKSQNGHSLFSDMAMNLVSQILSTVEKSVISATETMTQGYGMKTHIWIQKFSSGILDELHISDYSLKQVKERNIADFAGFQLMVLKQISEVKKKAAHKIGDSFDSFAIQGDKTIYKLVLDKLWGCKAICPFCHEPCRHTEKDHVAEGKKHSCIQHRPLAFKGVKVFDKKLKQNVLMILPCYWLVGNSKRTFNCSMCDNECQKNRDHDKDTNHEFSDYHKIFHDWDTRQSKKIEHFGYWCFFLDFSYILKRKYVYDLPHLPKSWRRVTHKKAKEYLLKSLNEL